MTDEAKQQLRKILEGEGAYDVLFEVARYLKELSEQHPNRPDVAEKLYNAAAETTHVANKLLL